jgi:hypothetical protein
MPVTLIQTSNANLLNLSTWTVGTGGAPGFPANGTTQENQRLNDTGPWGSSVLVWGTYPTATNDADGGWNSDSIAISNTSLYRYSVWVRRTSATTSGTFYFGLNTNGTNSVINLNDGAGNTNPYWDYRNIGWFDINQWYLVVGHLYPFNTSRTSANPESGIYTRQGGMVAPLGGNCPYDCKSISNTTTAMHRTYHYYCTDTTSRLQFFQPRIDLVDGNQPSVSTLLAQDLVSSSTVPQGIKFSDNTVQTSSFSSQDQHGELINITTFEQSGTWTKPTSCTRVLVKVVGGGGGAAGYMESGGGGGYAERVVDVTNVATVAVTIGAGGALVGYYAPAGDGGTSSFGSYCSASGGFGSNRNAAHTGGAGGTGSNGVINLQGGTGTGHCNSGGHYPGGNGGSTFFGSSATINRDTTSTKLFAGSPGTGGPGGRTNDGNAGTTGMPGLVVVYAYK